MRRSQRNVMGESATQNDLNFDRFDLRTLKRYQKYFELDVEDPSREHLATVCQNHFIENLKVESREDELDIIFEFLQKIRY